MLHSICNNRGIGLVEVVIAMFIAAIGVTGMLLLQAPAWKAATKADHLGRAIEIVQRQLEQTELAIMNSCNAVTEGTTQSPPIRTSGMSAAVTGDVTFNVSTTIASVGTNIWRVTVRVTWPLNTTGVTGNVIVSRQAFFKVGC